MANNKLKSDLVLASSVTENKKNTTINRVVESALIAARATKQSLEMCEASVKTATNACLAHYEKTGDMMPMDRLVKGLRELKHPTYTRMSAEIIAWCVLYSPIRWGADGKIKQLKEGDEGFKPVDQVKAQETSFTETPAAKRARSADAAATKKMLQPLTLKDFIGRLQGLRNTFKSAQEKDINGDIRGVDAKDMPKIKKLLSQVDTVTEAFAPAKAA